MQTHKSNMHEYALNFINNLVIFLAWTNSCIKIRTVNYNKNVSADAIRKILNNSH